METSCGTAAAATRGYAAETSRRDAAPDRYDSDDRHISCETETESSEDYESEAEDEYEWRFVDPSRSDRFSHKGDTLIPGAGTRWKRAEQGAVGAGVRAESDALVEGRSEEELEDELPWQVIALLDANITRDLMRSHAWREHKVRQAREGLDLPLLKPRSLEALASDAGDDDDDRGGVRRAENCWLYRAARDTTLRAAPTAGAPRGAAVAAGDYLRVVERKDGWLRCADGREAGWVAASEAAEATVNAAAPDAPEEPEPEAEALFDKPFEPRLEDGEGNAAAPDDADDDADASDNAPAAAAPLVPA